MLNGEEGGGKIQFLFHSKTIFRISSMLKYPIHLNASVIRKFSSKYGYSQIHRNLIAIIRHVRNINSFVKSELLDSKAEYT
jgi:hypothetical protein